MMDEVNQELRKLAKLKEELQYQLKWYKPGDYAGRRLLQRRSDSVDRQIKKIWNRHNLILQVTRRLTNE